MKGIRYKRKVEVMGSCVILYKHINESALLENFDTIC